MKSLSIVFFVVLCLCASASAQTTAFTYQGNLKNTGTPANGNFDFEFKLFDLGSAGTQQGGTIQRLNVVVANGIFTVSLDFGAGTLPGADRFLDIAVRAAGGGAFTALSPRQKVNSAPYSVRSLNSTTADSVAVGGIPGGSGNYVQNTTSPQVSSNFNISGNGTAGGTLSANIIRAGVQFNIGANKILNSDFNDSLFVGVGGGGSGLSAFGINTFVGNGAGGANDGNANTFIGAFSGTGNGSGNFNTLVGMQSNVGSDSLQNAVAIGANSMVSQSNSLVLGSINGVNGASSDTNVGIGTSAPISRLHLNSNSSNFALTFTNSANTVGRRGYRLAFDSDRFSFQSADDSGNFAANQMVINQASGNVGIGLPNPNAKLQVAGGNIYIAQPNSLIITSSNGACWFITVNNAGALSTISVTCP